MSSIKGGSIKNNFSNFTNSTTIQNGKITASNTVFIGANLDVCGNTKIKGNLDLSSNFIKDVSGIFFTDNTYIGHGQSFDISTSEILKIIAPEIFITTNKLEISGDVLLKDNLSVEGLTNLDDDLTVSGNTLLQSRLDVIGDVSLNNNLQVLGNVNLDSLLNVSGDTLLQSRLDVIGDVSLNNNLQVFGNVNLDSLLNVSGDTLLQSRLDVIGDVSLNSKLEVTDNTLLQSRLDVIGDVSLNSKLEVTDNTLLQSRLDVIGDVSLNSKLEVTDNTLLQSRLDVISDVSLNSKLEVTDNTLLQSRLDVIGDVSLNSKLEVTDNTLLKSRLDVISDVSLNSKLEVTDNTLLQSRLDVIGDVSLNSKLEVTNSALLQSRLDVIGDVSLNSKLEVTNSALLQSRLDVIGDVSLNSKLEVTNSALLQSRLDVIGDVSLNSKLEVNDSALLQSRLDVIGDVSLNSKLEVNDSALLQSRLDVIGDVSLNSKLEVNDSALLQSRLDVIGDVSLNSKLEVNDSALLQSRLDVVGDVSLNSKLEVTDNTLLQSRLDVVGDVSMNSKLEVNDSALLQSRLDVIGDVSLNSKLEVSGNSTLKSRLDVIGDVSMNSKLEVNDSALLQSRLDVIGDVSLNSKLEVSGNSTLKSRLDVIGDVSLNSKLEVNDSTLLQSRLDVIGNVSLNSKLEVSGNSTLKSRLDVIGDVSLNSKLEVNDSALLQSRLDVIGDVSMNSKLEVNDSALLQSRLDVIGDVSMNSKLEVNDSALLQSRLDVIGDVSMNSKLEVTDNTLLQSRLDVIGDVSMNSKLEVTDNTLLQSRLDVIGDVSLNSKLEVTDNTLLRSRLDVIGDVSLNSKLEVTDNTLLQSRLDVIGDVSLNSKLEVTDNTLLQSRLDVVGEVSLDDNLEVSGNSILKSRLDVYGDVSLNSKLQVIDDVLMLSRLDVINDVSLNSKLEVTDNTLLQSRLDVVGDVSMNSKLEVTDNTLLQSRLDVIGDVSLNSKLEVTDNTLLQSRLDVVGDVSMNSKLEVNNNTLLKSRLDVISDVSLNNKLQVLGNTLLKSKLNVLGDVNLNSRLSVNDDVSMNSNVEISGNTLLLSRLDVVNDVSMSSNVEIQGNTLLNSRLDVNGDVSLNNNLEVSGNVLIKSKVNIYDDLSMKDNFIRDLSGIFFTDGTYLGHGNSFDISTNETLKISSNEDIYINPSSKVYIPKDLDVSGYLMNGLNLDQIYANIVHNHDISDINLLQDKLDFIDSSLNNLDNRISNYENIIDISDTTIFIKNRDLDLDNKNITRLNKISNDSDIIINPSNRLVIEGNLEIDGSLTILGGATIIQTQTVEISDNIILINNNLDNTTLPPSGLVSGIEVNRGIENNYQFVFEELTDTFRIGEEGDLQAVATRDDNITNKSLVYWDNSNTILKETSLIYENNKLGINVTPQYELDVSGKTYLEGSLDVTSDVSLNGNVLINSRLDVNGDVSLNNNLEVLGDVILKSRLDVINDVSLNNNLEVLEDTKLVGRVDILSDTSLNNNLEVSGNVLIQTSLDVIGKTILDDILEVSGITLLKSSLDVCGNVNLEDNLSVVGNVTIKSSLDVSGEVDISGDLRMRDHHIKDVSGIYFSDGTYIGQGNSFDIITDQHLKFFTSNLSLQSNEGFNFDGKVEVSGNMGINAKLPSKDLVIEGNTELRGKVEFKASKHSWNAISDVSWSSRSSHTLNTLNDGSLILIDGLIFNNGIFNRPNDVWKSDDNGSTWYQISITGENSYSQTVPARSRHGCVVTSDNKIILFGGASGVADREDVFQSLNDVWHSDDRGETWTLVKEDIQSVNYNINDAGAMVENPNWSPRSRFGYCILPNNKIIIIGGYREISVNNEKVEQRFSDVWMSSDLGVTWTLQFGIQKGDTPLWGEWNSYPVFVRDNDIYVLGGDANDGKLWRSSDEGQTWEEIITKTDSGNLPRFTLSQAIVLNNNDILVLGGNVNGNRSSAIYRSQDGGFTWNLEANNSPWGGRTLHAVALLKNTDIIVVGGVISSDNVNNVFTEYVTLNDVWYGSEISDLEANSRLTVRELYIKDSLNVNGDVEIDRNLNVNNIVPADILNISGNINIDGLIFKNGEELLTGGVIKSSSDNSANELLLEKQETGDLYFNNLINLFKKFSTVSNAWFPIELGTIGGQPTGLRNINYLTNPNIITITWNNPEQVASGMTSDAPYNTPNSSASDINLNISSNVNRNMIYFPIVNRIVIKINILDENDNIIGVHNYPLYSGSGENDITKSYVDNSANVIYRKGDAIYGEPNSSRNSYISFDGNNRPNRNLLKNMPTGIKIYKAVPATINYQTNIIDSHNNNVELNLNSSPVNKYRIELWLENNSTITNVEKHIIDVSFGEANSPTQPTSVNINLLDNTTTNVLTSVSRGRIAVIDPTNVSDGINNDGIVLFNGIEFKWSIDGTNYYNFEKLNGVELNNGIFEINPIRNRDGTLRNYDFSFNSVDMGNNYSDISDNIAPKELRVMVRYRNTANSVLGGSLVSNNLVIGKPNKHSITSSVLTAQNEITLTIPQFNSADIINRNNSNNNISNSTNSNNAIYIKSVQFYVERKLDANNIEVVNSSLEYNYDGNTNNNSNSSYIYTIPDGLLNGTFAQNDYRLRFKVRVKNNIIDDWSEWSDVAGTTTEFIDNSNNSILITKMNNNNDVNTFTFNNQDTINVSWSHPNDGDRGILTSKASSGLARVYQYDLLISTDNPESSILEKNITTGNRLTLDAINNTTFDISSFIFSKGVEGNPIPITTSDDALTLEPNAINLILRQRNEYVSNYSSSINKSLYYSLNRPNEPIDNSSLSTISNTTSLNTLTIKWNKPTEPGLLYGDSLENITTNLSSMAINQYKISITADRGNSGSPYYRSLELLPNDPSINDIGVYDVSNESTTTPSITSDALLYISNNNGNITRNDIIKGLAPDRNIINNLSDVLVYPETTYTINVVPRNRYMIESDSSLTIVITTNQPSSITNQFTSSTLPLTNLPNNGDLSNTNNYVNKGYVLDSNDFNNTLLNNKVQISKINEFNIYTSTNSTHRLNTSNFRNFKPATEFITDVSNIKLRQFRIINKATDSTLLKYGSDDNQYEFVGVVDEMLSLSTSNSVDSYTLANYDNHNRGYWWQEDISYSINFNTQNVNNIGVPILLEGEMRYNNRLNENDYETSSLDTNDDVNIISRDILFNSGNTNSYVYFDDLSGNPSLSNHSIKDFIVDISNTNNINGIPNLYNMGLVKDVSCGYEYQFNYRLLNYSEYFALDSSINIVNHRIVDSLDTILVDNLQTRTWSNYNNMIRDVSSWEVSDLSINNVNIGTPNVSVNKDVRFQIVANNTNGSSILDIPETGLFRFILDRNTCEVFKTIVNSMREIPNNYLPDYDVENTTGTSNNMPSEFVSFGAKSNVNNKQLSMYDGKFYSNLGWTTITGINNENNNRSEYGIDNLAVFNSDGNYSWAIFKYQYNSTGVFNFTKIALSLGIDNSSNISNSNLLNEDVKVFVSLGDYVIKGGDNSDYHWFNIGKASLSITDTAANINQIIYQGTIGDSRLNELSDANFNNSSILNGSSSFINFTSNVPERLIGGRINVKSLVKDEVQEMYVAVGIRNNVNLEMSKPRAFIISNTNNADIKELA
jgi:cytoskeletal protein CcmA (bactofilin family)/phage baseplate assembly protein gpV